MAISKIYVYFNKKGEMVSKAPYIDTGTVRQGSDFELNILFDKPTEEKGDDLIEEGDMISISFKCPGESKYNLFPFLSFYDKYEQEIDDIELKFCQSGIKKFEEDLSKYGIDKETEYLCWTFNSVNAYKKSYPVLTERDGNLEVQIKIFEGAKATTPTNVLGTFKIFIERTLNYESPFDVSQPDLDRFVKEVEQISKTRGFGVHAFYIDELTGDLKVLAERSDDLVDDNYKINSNGELVIEVWNKE